MAIKRRPFNRLLQHAGDTEYSRLKPRRPHGGKRLGYCFTPYQRLWLYNSAPLVAFYDTLRTRRKKKIVRYMYSETCICGLFYLSVLLPCADLDGVHALSKIPKASIIFQRSLVIYGKYLPINQKKTFSQNVEVKGATGRYSLHHKNYALMMGEVDMRRVGSWRLSRHQCTLRDLRLG